MSNWLEFEQNSANYLNRTFGQFANFVVRGSSDSTVSDIEVTTSSGCRFYIEAKYCPAQCGQFVLLPNVMTRAFEYSSRNAIIINPYSAAIMNHMNSDFEAYKEAGTAGRDICFTNCAVVFANWVVQAYAAKGVRFIITNNYTILPVEEFSNYFDITAKYRIKRSGSSAVGAKARTEIGQYVKTHFPIIDVYDNERLCVTSNKNLHDQRFVIGGTEYMISQRENNYEIRKLSNTFNANVIFSITLKQNRRGLSSQDFISQLC